MLVPVSGHKASGRNVQDHLAIRWLTFVGHLEVEHWISWYIESQDLRDDGVDNPKRLS